jgi:RHS repeat-associated protein
MKYYPYGSTRSGSVTTDKLFTGQRLDDTGLYYYGARYYDASMGRFISPDPFVQKTNGFTIISSPLTVNFIPEGLGTQLSPKTEYPAVSVLVPINPQALNRYSYVLNNPLRYIDPTGWDTEGHGINFNIGFGIGISIEVLRVTDDKGNKAWTLTVSFLGTTPSASAGYQYQHTDAATVNDLVGWAGGGGGSIGVIPWYLPSGGEYVGYHKDEEGGWEGYNVNVGPQAAPVEVHATVGYTWEFGKSQEAQVPSLTISDSSSDNYYNGNYNYSYYNPSYYYYGYYASNYYYGYSNYIYLLSYFGY